ncbi:MAG: L,D-transpeptidase family protein [Alphaproteobacteria bacterium]
MRLILINLFRNLFRAAKIAALALFLGFAAAAPATQANATQTQLAALSSRIALEISAQSPLGSIDAPALQAFYGARAFAPIWITDKAGSALAQSTLMAAGNEGLNPEDYHASAIAKLAGGTTLDQVGRELLLTDGLLKYAYDLRLGHLAPNEVDGDIELPAQSFQAAGELSKALAGGTLGQFLADLPPPHPEYAALRDALKRYRKIAEDGGWAQFTFAPKDKSAAAKTALWARLRAEDASLGAQNAKDNNALSQALARFQARNGLAVDGKLSERTIDALNVPALQRISQIEANMERWRWLPRTFEADYVAVNVPDASLIAVHGGKTVLTSRVVVGRPNDPTPILRATITAVTANPPWDVPMSIARKEYLPKLRKDSAFLAEHHIFIKERPGDPSGATIAWPKVAARDFNYHLRQAPGPDNALGRVKLEMPNKYSVYLHDTPNTAVFANNDRDLSHGCMRVDRIVELASVALSGDPAAETDTVKALIDAGETKTVPLIKPIPIYALYWTAFVNGAGETQFRRDLYGRDGRLIALLKGQPGEQRLAESQGCPVHAG